MNENDKPTPQQKPDTEFTSKTDLDDDFANETLGERQEDACNLEEACTSCE